MASHSEAMRTAVHGKVQPLRPSLWGQIKAMLAEEAAVSLALGHKPQPPLWVGAVTSIACALIFGAVWIMLP